MDEVRPSSGRADSAGETRPGRADSQGYSRPLPDFSTNPPHNSASGAGAKGFPTAGGVRDGMDKSLASPLSRRFPDLDIAMKSIAGVWLLYITLVTLRSVVLQYPDFWGMLIRRTAAAGGGVAITFLVYLALRSMRERSLKAKAILAGILCLPASIAFASFTYFILFVYAPLDMSRHPTPAMVPQVDPLTRAIKSISEASLSWYFLFAAWAALYVAMSYAAQLRTADRRAALFEREAQDAQLRALRYQINPHFLFNTLNSLSSLVLAGRNQIAERMIMNLSTFFRTTLSADPCADLPLEEEIKLQRLYLDIEQMRFPERLKVEVDVPETLSGVRVPALLLQPIVENAVKYGVARSRRPVTVRISAYEQAGRLHLDVKDDADAPPEAKGEESGSTGVGLRNVCERLTARYGAQAGCFHGPDPEGGYSVHVVLPIARNG